MSNKELQLFVYEGNSAEPKYVDKLEKNFLGERIAIKCVYDAEIYQLYRQMKDDDFAIDIVSILKERSPQNAKILRDYNRDSFAYIYLFFDYDGHSTWRTTLRSRKCSNSSTMRPRTECCISVILW